MRHKRWEWKINAVQRASMEVMTKCKVMFVSMEKASIQQILWTQDIVVLIMNRRGMKNSMDMSQEYSGEFDKLRKNRVETSFYKYGPVRQNFESGNIQAIPTLELCLQKYKDTGNTEYLCDLANYAMFEFMYPQHPKAHFRATDSGESAGIVGMSVNEIKRFKENEI